MEKAQLKALGLRSLLALMGLLALIGCAQEEIAPARYVVDQCRRLTLVDAETGAPIRGAEDFAIDVTAGRLFLSAYDRRAVEKAVHKKAAALPQGGVYAVSLDAIFDPETESAPASPLISLGDIAGGLRPHGLSYDAGNQELVFINRSYQRIYGKWQMTPRLQRIGVNGEMFVGKTEASPCSANDVLVTEHHIFTSFDHGACDWRARVEDIFNLKRSGISSNHSGSVYARAAFANGLARTLGGDVVLSATRENALVILKEISNGVEERARITLPGGPDNLSISYDGSVVAATHPSMLRLALNRKLGLGKAPSRLIKADPDTGAVSILFDDPTGKLFSAATVAVETRRGLIAGSVTDEGVLVCSAA
jgi:hypothetical protein